MGALAGLDIAILEMVFGGKVVLTFSAIEY